MMPANGKSAGTKISEPLPQRKSSTKRRKRHRQSLIASTSRIIAITSGLLIGSFNQVCAADWTGSMETTPSFTRSFELFTLPNFQVDLNFPSDSAQTEPFLDIEKNLTSVTELYLTDQMRYSLESTEVGLDSLLHKVKLEGEVRILATQYSKRRLKNERKVTIRVRAQYVGQASFRADIGNSFVQSDSIDESMIRSLVISAFEVAPGFPDQYLETIQRRSGNGLLSTVDAVVVTTDIPNRDDSNFLFEMNEETNSRKEDDLFLRRKEAFIVFFMGAFICIFLMGFYVYLSLEYHRAKSKRSAYCETNARFGAAENGGLDMNMTANAQNANTIKISDSSKEDGTTNLGHQINSESLKMISYREGSAYGLDHLDRRQSGLSGNDEIVPVPARQDEVSSSLSPRQVGRHVIYPPVSRRYVQPASPFDVLYGATFLHHDRERVGRTYGNRNGRVAITKPSAASHRTTKKKKPRRPIAPMMSIAETESEEEAANNEYQPHSDGPRGAGFLSDIMKHVASYLDEKMAPTHSITEEEELVSSTNAPSPTGVEEMVVFRDFPRHDGTPYLIYESPGSRSNSKHDNRIASDLPLDVALGRGDFPFEDDAELSQCSSHSGVDSFVDKLETLVAARSRQYQERVKMDRERTERRKQRGEERRRERESDDTKYDEKDRLLDTGGGQQEEIPLTVEAKQIGLGEVGDLSRAVESIGKLEPPGSPFDEFKGQNSDSSSALIPQKVTDPLLIRC